MAGNEKENQEWSDYAMNLPEMSKQRYMIKLQYSEGTLSLPDPYSLRQGWSDDPTLWPQVTFPEIYIYLIETPGQFTHDSLKAYKSLKAYEYVFGGHVHPIQYHPVDKNSPFCLLKTKVIPSQRLRDKPHQPWVYVNKSTCAVYCGHCTCMAGLGEVCSHVAALLFKVDVAVRAGITTKSCTSDACSWNATYRKELQPNTINDSQELFSCRRKTTVLTTSASGKEALPRLEVLQSLKDVLPNAVFFKSIPPLDKEETDSADEEVKKTFPPTLISLRCTDLKGSDVVDIDRICKDQWNSYVCDQTQVLNLERLTRNQSISPQWYAHRKGRITGTKAHDILIMKDSTDPTNCIKRVMGYADRDISKVPAVSWGIRNEDKARKLYSFQQQQSNHINFSFELAGLRVCHNKPFLAASSDGLIACDCCGEGCVEIKCPYKHRDNNIDTCAQDPDFCLNTDKQLKVHHKYYTQIQLQMFVHDVTYCDFVIFTNTSLCINRVKRDDTFLSTLISKCTNFFFKHILPELITGFLEQQPKKTPNSTSVTDKPDEKEVWCLCQQEERGKMIMCEGPNCSYTWFHYECVDVRRKPRGAWFCSSCKMAA